MPGGCGRGEVSRPASRLEARSHPHCGKVQVLAVRFEGARNPMSYDIAIFEPRYPRNSDPLLRPTSLPHVLPACVHGLPVETRAADGVHNNRSRLVRFL